MKYLLLFAALFTAGFSQGQRTCATPQKNQELLANNPAAAARHQQFKELVRSSQFTLQSTGEAAQPTVVVTVPIVFHVLYKNATQNISEAQINSQLAVLNADFRKLNTDFSTVVPAVFQPLGADLEINFVKATVDPNGNPTNGITRKSVSQGFNFYDNYHTATGQPAWNTLEYLNIWIGVFEGQWSDILGFATPPAAAGMANDGLCIGYEYFGTMGTASAPFNKGRTATHEIGHYFGLEHPWGDDFSACFTAANSDGVADTPATSGPYGGCPSFPNNMNACTPSTNGSMFMNFMDYTNDACMAFFTNGQKALTQLAINGPRASVLGVRDLGATQTIKIYPNPVGDYFTISAGAVNVDKVEVFDTHGQLVKSQGVSSGDAQVKMSDLASGIYYTRIYSGGKFLKSDKLIKK